MKPRSAARQPRLSVEIPSIHNSRESEVAHNDQAIGFEKNNPFGKSSIVRPMRPLFNRSLVIGIIVRKRKRRARTQDRQSMSDFRLDHGSGDSTFASSLAMTSEAVVATAESSEVRSARRSLRYSARTQVAASGFPSISGRNCSFMIWSCKAESPFFRA